MPLTPRPLLFASALLATAAPLPAQEFDGRCFRGSGDVEYLQLLDVARRMLGPDAEWPNLPMLYAPAWNGLSEGPRWNMWWIQNSYGPEYAALPFLEEPLATFVANSNDLWFSQMGDGSHKDYWGHVGPDGVLCDAAVPGTIFYKQGDGQVKIHDWFMEATAAGLLLQGELLLVGRDPALRARDLPRLERVANFLDTRRDPETGLMLAGPACNLLAPSYAGWKKPDGTYDKAYLAGLSVTTLAALDRLIEVEKLAGRADRAAAYAERRDALRKGLPRLTTDEGYFVKSLDPDGTRHGVYGAKEHGYFEATVNHDAICFGIVDDAQARKIYAKISSIPGLRPHAFIIPNYPGLDDMYEKPEGIWEFGRWVNGGHWATCEARMMIAYSRLGHFEDARRSMKQLLTFARPFRMDAPLTKFGSEVWFTGDPIHLTVDAFGTPAGFVRGLFEYLYRADRLTLVPHVPEGITRLEQRFPVRFGRKRVYLSVAGRGPVTAVRVNGKPSDRFTATTVDLPYDALPNEARVAIGLGGAEPDTKGAEGTPSGAAPQKPAAPATAPPADEDMAELEADAKPLTEFRAALETAGLGGSVEAAHARLAVDMARAVGERRRLLAAGAMPPLPEVSVRAIDGAYRGAAGRLRAGLLAALKSAADSPDPARARLYRLASDQGLFKSLTEWNAVRSEGTAQTFRRRAGGMRMTLEGGKDASCGWAYDLAQPVTVPEGGRLAVTVSGSPGARHFVDLLTPEGGIGHQVKWTGSPAEPAEKTYELPKGLRIGRIILYTMTPGGTAHNDFARVAVVKPDGTATWEATLGDVKPDK